MERYALETDKSDSQQPHLWDNVAKQYSAKPDKAESEIASELESILAGLGIGNGSTLLEAGCGSGHVSSILASNGYKTALLDFSEVALEKAKQLYQAKGIHGDFVYSDIFDMSAESVGTHDIVWNSGVLEHFDGWQVINALQKMADVAKKFVIILVPNPGSNAYLNYRRKALKDGSWQWGLEILRDNLGDLVRLAGLEVVQQQFAGRAHLDYFEEFVNPDRKNADVPDDQKYLTVMVARPTKQRPNTTSLLWQILKDDSAALRRTYNYDVAAITEGFDTLELNLKESQGRAANLEAALYTAKNDIKKTQAALDTKQQTIKYLEELLHSEQSENLNLKNSLDYERKRLDALLNTKTWKLTKLYEKKFQGNIAGKMIESTVDLVLGKDEAKPDETKIKQTSDEIKSIVSQSGNIKGIIVYPPTVDWNIPLFQRPQHMAANLAGNGWLYFYCTTNSYDKISGFEKISENLYLTDKFDDLVETLDSFFMFIHCAHPTLTIQELEKFSSKAILIYDYLDMIHPDVSGLKAQDILERHTYMLQNSSAVLVTARELLDEVTKLRQNGVYFLPNAVDYDHFHDTADMIPAEIKSIRDFGGPILGYFGAIAKWIDYKLIKGIARENPSWNFVLIGWDYDGTIKQSGIDKFENIHYLGVKKYDELPRFAAWFDVCILPFIVNQLTDSTSPIKLFEYMALGKPIVATPIKEVKNYKSPLVATADQFASKIREALLLCNDAKYLSLVDDEARQNTWKKRFKDLDKILRSLQN